MSEENQEQIDYWNNRAGKTWTELQERTDQLLHPFSQEAIDRLNPRGEQIGAPLAQAGQLRRRADH